MQFPGNIPAPLALGIMGHAPLPRGVRRRRTEPAHGKEYHAAAKAKREAKMKRRAERAAKDPGFSVAG